MNCSMTKLAGAAALLGALASSAAAAPMPDVYDRSGAWTIEAWLDGPDIRFCSATIANPSAQPDFGSFLRVENDGQGWSLASDYFISGNSMDTTVLVDGAAFPVHFVLEDDVVRGQIDQRMVDAMAAGRRINLNFDPAGQNFSLRGSQAAFDLAAQCIRGSGMQNVGNALTNEYGGYDIGGTPEGEEDFYGQVRGWRVVAGRMGGSFAYCAGEIDDRGTIWRLGWDGMQWQAAVVADVQPDWNGYLDVDGDSRPISGSAKGGWALLWLGLPELDKIRQGNRMIVELGRASIEHPLVGTAAVVTKIEECVARKGGGGGSQAGLGAGGGGAPASGQPSGSGWFANRNGGNAGGGNAGGSGFGRPTAGGAGCPDDGPRLPVTGLCAGRAVNYLTGSPTYGDYLPDPSCEWVVNEVQVIEDALLYRALRCNGVTSQLEYAGGGQWAQLMVVRSALNAVYGGQPDVSDPKPAVWFNWIDPSDVEGQLDMRSRLGFEAELSGRSCAIERADPAVSPDGWVFDITPSDPMYAQREQEPMGAQCGPFSYGDGSVRFWRVLGDNAFLFDMSADVYQDFDPNSVTLLRKDASGAWAPVQ
jgi:hypothetical protein